MSADVFVTCQSFQTNTWMILRTPVQSAASSTGPPCVPCEPSVTAEETRAGPRMAAATEMKMSGIRQAGWDQQAALTARDEQAASVLVLNLP